MKLITVGDNVADTYTQERVYFPGGNCVNVAVDAKRAGAKVAGYLGILGDDDRADHIRESLRNENVQLINCRKAYGPTAQPQVLITADGDRVFAAGPKNSVQHLFSLQLTVADLSKITAFDVLHVSLYSGIEKYLPQLKKKIKISFDFSDCHEESYIKRISTSVDYAFFSGSELSDIKAEKLARKYLSWGPEVVVITRGAAPALLMTAEQVYYQKPQNVQLVDTMGAGDSFIGGFLVSYTENNDLLLAASQASKSAAATCQIAGGFGYKESF